MTFLTWWRGLSLGLFLIAIAAIVHSGADWQWIFVVMLGMSLVNAVAKGRWRWVPQPLMWGVGLWYAYTSPPEGQPGHIGGWTMFIALCGASLVLSFVTNLIPEREPPEEAPPRPGARVVIDVEASRPGDGQPQ